MDKPTLTSGIRRTLEIFLNLPRQESWNPSAIEEDITGLKDEGQMKLERRPTRTR